MKTRILTTTMAAALLLPSAGYGLGMGSGVALTGGTIFSNEVAYMRMVLAELKDVDRFVEGVIADWENSRACENVGFTQSAVTAATRDTLDRTTKSQKLVLEVIDSAAAIVPANLQFVSVDSADPTKRVVLNPTAIVDGGGSAVNDGDGVATYTYADITALEISTTDGGGAIAAGSDLILASSLAAGVGDNSNSNKPITLTVGSVDGGVHTSSTLNDFAADASADGALSGTDAANISAINASLAALTQGTVNFEDIVGAGLIAQGVDADIDSANGAIDLREVVLGDGTGNILTTDDYTFLTDDAYVQDIGYVAAEDNNTVTYDKTLAQDYIAADADNGVDEVLGLTEFPTSTNSIFIGDNHSLGGITQLDPELFGVAGGVIESLGWMSDCTFFMKFYDYEDLLVEDPNNVDQQEVNAFVLPELEGVIIYMLMMEKSADGTLKRIDASTNYTRGDFYDLACHAVHVDDMDDASIAHSEQKYEIFRAEAIMNTGGGIFDERMLSFNMLLESDILSSCSFGQITSDRNAAQSSHFTSGTNHAEPSS